MRAAGVCGCFFGLVLLGACAASGVSEKPTGEVPVEGAHPLEMQLQTGHSQRIAAAVFSPDGAVLATAAQDGSVKLWDVATGLMLRSLPTKETFQPSVVFSTDGHHILTATGDDTRTIWDVTTGERLEALEAKGGVEILAKYNFSGGDSLARSIDVKGVAFEGSAALIIAEGTKRVVVEGGAVLVSDVSTSETIQKIEADDGTYARATASPGGRFLLLNHHKLEEGIHRYALVVWDVNERAQVGRYTGARDTDDIRGAINRAGDRLLLYVDQVGYLWDMAEARVVWTLGTDLRFVDSVDFSPDGRHILTSSDGGVLVLWDLASLRPTRTTYLPGEIAAVSFGPDGRRLAVSFEDSEEGTGEVHIRSVATDAVIQTLELENAASTALFVPEGDEILVDLGEDSSAATVSLEEGEPQVIFEAYEEGFERAAISSDGRLIISAGCVDYDGNGFCLQSKVDVWVRATGSRRTLGDHKEAVGGVAFAPDGKLAVSTGWDGLAKVWDVASGKLVRSFAGHGETLVGPVDFHPKGELVATGDASDTILVWSAVSGEVVRKLEGHGGWVKSLAFSPDGRLLLSGSEDGTARLWEVDTGKSLVLLSEAGQWLVYNDEGLFDGSPRSSSLVAMVQGRRAFGIDQLALTHNRPDLLLASMGLGDEAQRDHYLARTKRRLRKAGVQGEDAPRAVDLPEAQIVSIGEVDAEGKVVVEVSLGDAVGLASWQLYADGVPLFVEPAALSGTSARVSGEVQLIDGDNKIEVSALSTRGLESLRDLRIVSHEDKTRGDLYLVALGISKYRDSSLDLRYAHKDAEDLVAVFEKMEGYGKVHAHAITNEGALALTIMVLGDALEGMHPRDTFVLFIAGHGVHDGDEAGTYYYLTHETDLKDLSGTAASFELIEGLLMRVKARKKLFLMDTCQSGEVDEEAAGAALEAAGGHGISARGFKNKGGVRLGAGVRKRPWLTQRDRFIYLDLSRRSGAIVLSSSRGHEFSYEGPEVENGYFTEAILSALTGTKADGDGNGWVSTDELRAYVAGDVRQRTKGLQNPTVDRDNIVQRFGLPVVLD